MLRLEQSLQIAALQACIVPWVCECCCNVCQFSVENAIAQGLYVYNVAVSNFRLFFSLIGFIVCVHAPELILGMYTQGVSVPWRQAAGLANTKGIMTGI